MQIIYFKILNLPHHYCKGLFFKQILFLTDMGKIKVAFFSDLLVRNFDGAVRTMYQIIDRIPKEEFEYLFICGMPPKEDIGFEVMQVPTIKVPRNENYEMSFIPFFKNKLRQKLKEFQPDIIQFASPSQLSTFANKYGKENNIPVVTIYHTHFISYMQYYVDFAKFLIPIVERKVAKIIKSIYDEVDAAYVPTEEIRKQLLEKCNLKGDNIRIWARGLKQDAFDPAFRKENYFRQFTQNDKPNILFASRLVMEKNLKLVAEVYKKSEEKGSAYNFIIVGDGAARKKLEKWMPNAFFLGSKSHEELSTIYASADLFFFPSLSETFGNVITEAMASGLPCVLSSEGGHISFAEHNKVALLCPPDNADAFLNAFEQLLKNDTLRTNLVKNALEFTKTLDWDALVDAYFDDIRKFVNN